MAPRGPRDILKKCFRKGLQKHHVMNDDADDDDDDDDGDGDGDDDDVMVLVMVMVTMMRIIS